MKEQTAKVNIIIPTKNEERSISKVIKAIPKRYRENVYVVDSLSKDKTRAIALSLNVKVIKDQVQSYDAACFLGAKQALKSDILVFLHAGGDDEPKEIQKLIDPIIRNDADLVIGSRTIKKGRYAPLHLHQYLGTKLIVTLINFIYSTNFVDIGPFRAIRTSSYQQIKMEPKRFSWTTQMMIKALSHNLRIKEIPVTSKKRIGRSKISGSLYYSTLAMMDMFWSFKFIYFKRHDI